VAACPDEPWPYAPPLPRAVSIGIALYLAMRFEWQFAAGAIFATAHDIFIVLGVWSLFQWDFSLTPEVGVLAKFGKYSNWGGLLAFNYKWTTNKVEFSLPA